MDESLLDQIVRKLGFRSGAELARALGRSRKAASRWRKDGIPAEIRLQLLDLALERGVELSHVDLRPEVPSNPSIRTNEAA